MFPVLMLLMVNMLSRMDQMFSILFWLCTKLTPSFKVSLKWLSANEEKVPFLMISTEKLK